MSLSRIFAYIAIVTLAVGFAFHVLYITGAVTVGGSDRATSAFHTYVIVFLLPIFALFTMLAYRFNEKSVAVSLLYTLVITEFVMITGCLSVFIMGLSL